MHEALENVWDVNDSCLRGYWECICTSSDEDDEAVAVCIEIKKTSDRWRRFLELEKESARVGKVLDLNTPCK